MGFFLALNLETFNGLVVSCHGNEPACSVADKKVALNRSSTIFLRYFSICCGALR